MQSKVPRTRGRPPKAAGGYREARELLCAAGLAVLTEKGYSSPGLDEILRTAGVPKGSFYHYFGSKEEFGVELISRYSAYFVAKLNHFLCDETLPPLERIVAFCADAERGMKRYAFRRGCLVGNLGQEAGTLPATLVPKLRSVLLEWQQLTESCLQEAKSRGALRAGVDPKEWSEFFWIGWEGAVLRAKLERRAAPLRLFANRFMEAIQP